MNIPVSVSVNLFPMLMLLIIYVNNHKKTAKTADKRLFDVLTLLGIGVVAARTAARGIEGMSGSAVTAGLWISYMAYMWMLTAIAAVWFLYVCSRLKREDNRRMAERLIRFFGGVQFIWTALVVTTPWTRWLFFIAEDNTCRQGEWYGLPYLEGCILFLITVGMSLRKVRQENMREQRWECICMAGCGLLSLTGFIVQYLQSAWWGGASCLSLAVLFVYLNAQNRQITTDALTGLNNRREFERQLARWTEQAGGDNWGMLLLDIDDFKKINDDMGHTTGDEALWEAADILRRIFGREKNFLARYGGDEFAVIGVWKDKEAAKQAILAVGQEVDRFNQTAGKRYRLSCSIGYALWDETQDAGELVKLADERMYCTKVKKKHIAAENA